MKKRNQLVEAVIADYERRKIARRALELQWNLSIDFYQGRQNGAIAFGKTIANHRKQFRWQNDECFNHTAPIIEARLARINQGLNGVGDGRPQVAPTRDLVNRAIQWSEVTGTAFYKTVVGATCGRPLVSVHSPHEIFPDCLGAQDMSEVGSLIHAKMVSVSGVRENWGVDLGYTGEESVLVIERWERPTKAREGGRLTIVAHDKLLHDGDLPFVTGLPFVRQVSESMVGSFYGSSVIERIIPVQRAYNVVKNRKVEYLNRMACGVLCVEEGSVDLDDLKDGLPPGKVIVYRHGSREPKFLEAGSLPRELEHEEERLLREFETISAGEESVRGAAVDTAAGMEIVEQRDERKMSRVIEAVQQAISEVEAQIKKLEVQYGKRK